MKREKQIIAIAEYCGYTHIVTDKYAGSFGVAPGSLVQDDLPLPAYLDDLNAMHMAEKVLTIKQVWTYHEHLNVFAFDAANNPMSIPIQRWTHGSTASQRAESFLKTIGKWTDD